MLGAGAASGRAVVVRAAVRRVKGERAGAKAPSFGALVCRPPSSCEESGLAESWARTQVLTSSSKARFELIEPRDERTSQAVG